MLIKIKNNDSVKAITPIVGNFIEVELKGYLYCIYRSHEDKTRLYLDVYPSDDSYESETTTYNGMLPVKRNIFDWLRNRISDYKTWLCNVTVNRKAIKAMRDKYDTK